jgi:crotonobetainyl-CoA:carnitine CoA-transferase CaiB-like acyl-CoA transferase
VRAGVSIVDFGTGMWAVIGIVSALYRRQRKHNGATVNSSLLETALAWMSIGIANYNADGEPGARHGSGVAFIVPHRAYETADGHLIVSCANDKLFARLCDALGRPEWASDERFATNAARLRNRAQIDGLDRRDAGAAATRGLAGAAECRGASLRPDPDDGGSGPPRADAGSRHHRQADRGRDRNGRAAAVL